MLNLSSFFETVAREYPGKSAVVLGETRLNYARLNATANRVAHALVEWGIGPGDKVALSCPNLPFFPMLYFGILKAGAVVVPLNVLLKKDEIAYHLRDSQAAAYFCFEGTPELAMVEEGYAAFQTVPECRSFCVLPAGGEGPSSIDGAVSLTELCQPHPVVFETVQTSGADTAVILYTSGTTGRPKGAELTHENLVMNTLVSRDILHGRTDDVHLVCLPLFHSFGQVVQMNVALASGATLVLLPRFDPNGALALMAREKVTVFCGVPTMYWAILNQSNLDEHDLPAIAAGLRVCCSGGASLPVELLHAFEKMFHVPILEGYGLSETSPVATFSKMEKPREPGSVGMPITGVRVRVVDENDREVPPGERGEIAIAGHNVMKGYYRKPEATAAAIRNGWFHTGDIGKMDEEGYFYIVDRLKDMIIRGGFNVYPRELEEVLLEHPHISLAAVVGIPDAEHGEEIKAFVVAKPGSSLVPQEVVEWARQRMAAYKYPRLVEVREALPMNATGKILKRALRVEAGS